MEARASSERIETWGESEEMLLWGTGARSGAGQAGGSHYIDCDVLTFSGE